MVVLYRCLSRCGEVTIDDTIMHPTATNWPPGEMHDTGQEEVETVDWLGLNQRLGVSKDQLGMLAFPKCLNPNTPQSPQLQDADNKPQEVRFRGLVD